MLIKYFIVVLLVSMGSVAKAQSTDENKILCGYYAKMGSVVTKEMLPLTFKEVVDMIGGRNQAVLAKITDAIIKTVNGTELVSVGNLSQGDQALLNEASGQIGIQLLMSGQASSSEEVGILMGQVCLANGIQSIIDNQRAAKELVERSMGN